MSKVLVEESSLHGVGNGIRYVNGKNTTYKPSEFEDAIKDLKPNLGTKTLTENGTYPASDDDLDGFSSVKVAVPPSSAVLVEKTITENGDYDPADDDADGYSAVSVEVPNSYAAEDEGKVVDGGELVAQTQKSISTNGTHDTTTNDEVVVAVPNSYGAGDEGKVVSSGALVAQTAVTKNANGTYDTTLNNQVVVAVPNTYGAWDEGKVVSSGALVSQTSRTVDENGTYDTTLNNEIVVNVPQSVDKKYYNGVLLPVLPEVSGYPYAIIQFRTDTVSVAEPYLYKAYFGKTKWYSSVDSAQDPSLSYRDWQLTPDAATEYEIYGYNGVSQKWVSLGSSLDDATPDTVHTTDGHTILWTSDNIYLDSTRFATDVIMRGTDSVSDPPTGGDGNHRYYNGILLPTLPAVSGYPYAIIQKQTSSAYPYMAYFGLGPWYGGTGATLEEWGLTCSLDDFMEYRYDAANDQWVYVKNSQDSMPPDKVYTTGGTRIVWTGDDIFQSSSMTAGTEIMRGTEAVVSGGGMPSGDDVTFTDHAGAYYTNGNDNKGYESFGNQAYANYKTISIILDDYADKIIVIDNRSNDRNVMCFVDTLNTGSNPIKILSVDVRYLGFGTSKYVIIDVNCYKDHATYLCYDYTASAQSTPTVKCYDRSLLLD